jgi:hypothetical protein
MLAGALAGSQLSISNGGRFGSQTRIATGSISFVRADEKLTAFLELESACSRHGFGSADHYFKEW